MGRAAVAALLLLSGCSEPSQYSVLHPVCIIICSGVVSVTEADGVTTLTTGGITNSSDIE